MRLKEGVKCLLSSSSSFWCHDHSEDYSDLAPYSKIFDISVRLAANAYDTPSLY